MAQQEHNVQNATGFPLVTPVQPMPEGNSDEPKLYHTRYPGSNFVDRYGAIHSFNGAGDLSTASLALQFELDKIADKGGSPIFTKQTPVIERADLAPAEDIQQRAAVVVAALRESQKPKN